MANNKEEVIVEVKFKGTEQIVRTKQQLEELKLELSQLRKDIKKGGADVGGLSKQMAEKEATVKKVTKTYRENQKSLTDLGKAQNKSGSFTLKMAKAFGIAQLAVDGFKKASQALMNQVRDSVKVYADFDIQMQKVKAISGANATEFGKLSKSAQELGRSTFFTATQVAELQMNFSKLGFTATETLDAQSAALDMATATGEDLARTATVIGSSIRGFNLDASEAGRVADVMAASFTSSALDLEKFQTSMTKVAPIAELMGVSMEATTAIMGKLSDAGIEASIAGTSLRNVFLKMGDPTSDLSKALGKTIGSGEELVAELKNLRDAGVDVEKMLAVVDQRQVAAFATMVKGVDVIESQILAFENAEGAAASMASTVGDSLQGAMLRFKSALDGLKIAFVENIAPALQNTIDGFAKLFNNITRVVETPLSESLEQDRLAMNDLFTTLQKTNLEQDTRKRLIERLNLDYKEYLPNLITEETTLDDLAIAQRNANSALQERINLLAAEEILSEIKRRQLEAQINLNDLVTEETKIEREQLELLSGATERANQSRQGTDLALSDNKVALQDNRAAQEENRKEIEKLSGEYEAATKAVLDLGGSIETVSKKNTKIEPIGGKDIVPEDEETSGLTPAQQELKDIELQLKQDLLLSEQAYADNITFTRDMLNRDLLDLQIMHLEEMTNIKGLEFDVQMDLEMKLAKAKSQLKNEDLKQTEETEKAKSQLIQANIDNAMAIGSSLTQIGQLMGKNSAAAKAGIAITKAASVASAIKGIIDAKASITKQASEGDPFSAFARMAIMAAAVAPLIASLMALKGGGGGGGESTTLERGESGRFARGGLTRGGVFEGASHAHGGVKFAVGGRIHEAEGGEAIINKRSTSAFRPILSAINSYNGNGVKFADGGLISSGEKFAMGGELRSVQQIVSGGMGSAKVVMVESDVTKTQNRVNALESQASF